MSQDLENNYLSVKEQIKYLEYRKMTFKEIEKKKAINILKEYTYFHKLISYKHFFSHYYVDENGEDCFAGLDFNDIYEIYKIDGILREQLNDICFEVENYFKVFILRYIDQPSNDCDHYFYYNYVNIDKVYKINDRMKKRVKGFNDLYSRKNLERYPDKKPIWVLNEYLSFGEVLEIFERYCKKKKINEYNDLIKYLRISKNIRNITAHNNKLFVGDKNTENYGYELIFFIYNALGVELNQKLIENNFTHNITATLFVYHELVPNEIYKERINRLFVEIHTILKTNNIFKKHKNEKIIKDIENLYQIINKLY